MPVAEVKPGPRLYVHGVFVAHDASGANEERFQEVARKINAAAEAVRGIYLSGPMTGMPDLNFPAFNAQAARLRAKGLPAVNPVEINPDPGMGWHQCMRRDLQALLSCEKLALLPGWQRSQGAHLEMHVAHRVGIEITNVEEL